MEGKRRGWREQGAKRGELEFQTTVPYTKNRFAETGGHISTSFVVQEDNGKMPARDR